MKLVAFMLAGIIATPVSAATVNLAFTAEFDRGFSAPTTGSLAETIGGISTLSGTVTYGTATLDTDPRTSFGDYATGLIQVDQVDLGAATTERFLLGESLVGRDALSILTGFAAVEIGIDLVDLTNTVFNTDALPMSMSLDQFNSRHVLVVRDRTTGFVAYNYTLTSLEPVVANVPLPAGLPLILTGLAGLIYASRRKTL